MKIIKCTNQRRMKLFFFLVLFLLFFSAARLTAGDETDVHIGVLAKRSPEQCLKQWQPLADYLNAAVSGYNFIIVPLGFDEIEKAVAEQAVDFMVSNPAIYVNLEAKYGATRIVTMNARLLGTNSTRFGGVIFTRKDREDIRRPADLKGKDFMAVDPTAFGGWHTSWRYLKEHEINPHGDFRSLRYGHSHDRVVREVLEGKVDAGAIRSGILEQMDMEGKIQLQDFYVIDDKRATGDAVFMHTTRLYPEWAFAMLVDTELKLAEKVAVALLEMPQSIASSGVAENAIWTIPLDYQSVHQCLQELHISPYEDFGRIDWRNMVQDHLMLLLGTVATLVGAWITTAYFLTLSRRQRATAKRLNRELDANKIMEEQLQQFKLTLDQTLDSVFMFEPDSLKYIYANQGATNQVGYSLGELLAMTPLDLKPEYGEQQYREILAPLLLGKKKSLTFATTHRTKGGDDIPVEIIDQYVELSDGQHRFVSVVRDISKRLAEDQEKEKLQTRLLQAQKLESVGRLAAGIAHEINTPTQFIGSNIDFLDEAAQDITTFVEHIQQIATTAPREIGDKIRDALEEADWEYLSKELPQAISQSRDGVQRVSSIVRAMKEFSHPGSKDKETQSLNKIIDTTVTVAGNEWKYVANVEKNLDPELPNIPLLADEIGQVILNILVNAAHAIAEKLGDNPAGDKGTITITTRQVGDAVELRLSDTGAGIPEEARPRIFDPFYTTKKVGKGTGQGLAISHDVITDKHAGSISFTTETGKGTEFVISLPIKAASNKNSDEEEQV